MPCVIIGAATMKMMSSTSITSTSGTTLISASDVVTRTPRARRLRPDAVVGIGWTFGTPAPSSLALSEISFRDVQELEREIIHARRKLLHPVREVVVKV